MRILAIETSCDETAAAVLEVLEVNHGKEMQLIASLFSNIVSSQIKIHQKYGGIVPEIAARKQIEMILPVIEKSLVETTRRGWKSPQNQLKSVDYIAVTQGPGLITSLTVGVETAKTLSLVLNKPLVAVNHLVGHIYANFLKQKISNFQFPITEHGQEQSSNFQFLTSTLQFPALALVVSGGHTLLILMKNHLNFKVVGQTLDDAAGEAFDKVAKILNLGYPGGPVISKLAKNSNPYKFDLPRPMINSADFNFSFSGLKTAVLYLTLKHENIKTLKQTRNLCASFQQAIIDVLISKTVKAIKKYNPKNVLLGGGVAANSELRMQLQNRIFQEFPKVKLFMPEIKFTGDNAAMIAMAAYFKIKHKTRLIPQLRSGQTKNKVKTLKADPNLTLF